MLKNQKASSKLTVAVVCLALLLGTATFIGIYTNIPLTNIILPPSTDAVLVGPAGADGATWLSGALAPGSGVGVNGDFYLHTVTNDVYKKISGTWTVVTNIKGLQGLSGAAGADALQPLSAYTYLVYQDGSTFKAQHNNASIVSSSSNSTALTDSLLGGMSGGTLVLYQVPFDLALFNSIPEDVAVVESINGLSRTFINPLDTQGSPYTISVSTSDYFAQDSAYRYCYYSTNASYIFNTITSGLNSQGKGGLINVRHGEYNLTNSIISYGGIKIQGEGLNKYLNQSGTKLQLSGGSFPLIIVNGSAAIGNQYFATISDMELYGNTNTLYTLSSGLCLTNCSAGVMFTGQSSDYLLENLFIHGVGVCVYCDDGSWFGRISKCWLEGSGIGVYAEQKQLIIAETNISGDTYGIYLAGAARDVLVSASHIYLITHSGVYIEKRTAGTYGFNFDTCDFTDCTESSFTLYAYTGVNLNVTAVNCNFGFQDGTSQKRGISTWTAGTGDITVQVGFSRFYSVTTNELAVLSSSTDKVTYLLGYNSGNITNTAP